MLSKFTKQSLFVKIWALPTWILLGISKLAISMFSFRFLSRYLGCSLNNASLIPLLTMEQVKLAKEISIVIQGVAPYTPWESNCFPQAVTARILLRIYGVPGILFFGVRKSGLVLEAHAWVCAGKVRVTGGYGFNNFAIVDSYLFEK